VLFICHGNIMRSALAEALMASRVSSHHRSTLVRSAGLHAVAGRPADGRMKRAAADYGISLDAHRAAPVTEQLLAEADIVLVMDYLNETELLARFPSVEAKLRLLGSFAPSESDGAEIADPFSGDETSASECGARVSQCVDALIASMRGSGPDRRG